MEKKPNPPSSVRFDSEKMNFIKQKEGLDSVQKVFTFLLDKYWWEHKIVSPFSIPLSEVPTNGAYINTSSEVVTQTLPPKKSKKVVKKENQEQQEEGKTLDRRFGTDIEPAEGTNRFFIKYGAFTHEEAKAIKK